MKIIAVLFFFSLVLVATMDAQKFTITGQLKDITNNTPIAGSNIAISYKTDQVKWSGTTTDNNGYFLFKDLAPGKYHLKITFLGYKTIELNVTVSNKNINLGVIKMEQGSIETKQVTIKDKQVRVEQKGDTTEYNSNAYKTNKDANTEDLVKKLPGVTVDQGTVKAHGEDVKKVLIDGQEVFGDDPTITLRNMPSEIVDKIQVFDKLSDQSQFTGFDDGNSQKTMNIITKTGRNQGIFGKVYAGYGTDDHYLAGGNLNFFNGKRRISIIGLSNNVNQQNFSSQDLLGITGSSNQGRGGYMPTGRSSRGSQGRTGFTGGQGGGAGNFLVGQQAGINTTNSLGFNYIDVWAKKVSVSFSYFFNNSNNVTHSSLDRQYILSDTTNQLYKETSDVESKNFNHRFSLRMQYDIDSSNSLIFQPRFNIQKYNSSSNVLGSNLLPNNLILSQATTDNSSSQNGYNFSSNLLYRHKFTKVGRTISLNIGSGYNDKSGESHLYSLNQFYIVSDSGYIYNQHTNSSSNGYSVSGDLNYTEPLSKKSIIQLNYSPSYSQSNSKKETNNFDSIAKDYIIPDTALSNKFDNHVLTQRAGLSYRLRGEKYNFSTGVNYQNVTLSSAETFPLSLQVDRSFDNLLPNANLQYKFSKSSNLRFFYRTSTSTPNISQLQNVIDNSNPLYLSTGNPDLKQEYQHSLVIRYNLANPEKAKMFFAFLSASYTNNYIGTSTFYAQADSILDKGIVLHRGSQLSEPVNLSGYWNVGSFLTYGFAVNFLKSNLNLNAGGSYNRTPGLINNTMNLANNYLFYGGLVLGSNISEKVDFTLTYTANYNMVENSLQPQLNSHYFYHISTFKLNLLPWKGLVLSTDLTHTLYTGLGQAYDKSILLWDAGIGYKFLKNNAAEFRLTAFDLLNQNNSISRTVSAAYIEDNITQVLNRYFMLMFTYTLRSYKSPKYSK